MSRNNTAWTKAPPTEPGWYWWRLSKHHWYQAVQVHDITGRPEICLDDNRWVSATKYEGGRGEWQGPVTPVESGGWG